MGKLPSPWEHGCSELPIPKECSPTHSGMIKKPQGKPVIERKDMEVVSWMRHRCVRAPLR